MRHKRPQYRAIMTTHATIRLSSPQRYALEVSRRVLVRDFGLHSHDHIELFIVLHGSAVHLVDGRQFYIRAGDVYVLGVGHSHSFTRVSALTHYNIGFDPELLLALGGEVSSMEGFQRLFVLGPGVGREVSHIPKLQLSLADLRRAESIAEAVRVEHEKRTPGWEVAARVRFLELVVFLSRRYAEHTGEGVDGLLRLARAAAHIERHFAEPVSVGELAMLAGMSPGHFSRVFHRHYHASPGAYVQGLRIQYAAFLLTETERAVTRVAFDSGFVDSNYFSRQFRRFMGVSPREYRRRHRQAELARAAEVV